MDTNTKNVKIIFITGYWLISCVALVLLISSLSFFAGIGITALHYPISFLIAGTILFFLNRRYYNDDIIFIKSFLLSISVIILSVIISSYFYDITYDGQTYHMEGIYRLKNGWNPYYSLLPKNVNMSIFINHYSKGVEIPQAALYSITNKIETVKANNFIILIASFCLTLSYLLDSRGITLFKSILISLAAAFNPVAANQLLSTYVDGQLASLILCMLISILYVVKNASFSNLFLLASTIIISCNIKFTGLIYVIIFGIGLIIWVFFYKRQIFKPIFYTILISGLVSVLAIGFNPYIINIINFNHPFYPLMGPNKVDIISYNLPNGLQNKSSISKFFISLFSRTDNIMNTGKSVELKIPFSVNKVDILNAPKMDTRVAGFGPLFSGILLLSFLILALVVIKFKNNKHLLFSYYLIGVIIISSLINPESWWARYIPQMWFVPIIILVLSESYKYSKKKLISAVLYVCLMINICFSINGYGYIFLLSRLVDFQITKLKNAEQPIKVQWNGFNINRVRFYENKIKFIESDISLEKDKESFVRSDAAFLIKKNNNIPKSIFVKWAEKLWTIN